MRNILNSVFVRLGYKLIPLKKKKQRDALFFVNQNAYINSDGTFDLEKYRAIQIEGNKRKLDRVWVIRENIEFLSSYIKERVPGVQFGICHGTRRGVEQAAFREDLKCDVFGTEISDTATQFPHTIQWDFHDVKDEWINHFDFIYSNSIDHSYDPSMCINQWMKCLKPGGICIIEYSNVNEPNHVDDLDPFGAKVQILPYLFLLWSKGKFGVVDILDAPQRHPDLAYLKFLILKRFD